MSFSIPYMNPGDVAELAERIKPVGHQAPNGEPSTELFFFPDTDVFNAFMWNGLTTVRAEGLKPLKTIRTLHKYGYYGFFKPSIAEVLAQIPAEDLGIVVAFEVAEPETAEDMNKHREELNAGFHVSETILYVKEPT